MSRMSQADDDFEAEVQRRIERDEHYKRVHDEVRRRREVKEWSEFWSKNGCWLLILFLLAVWFATR
jgi:hypothetical protein